MRSHASSPPTANAAPLVRHPSDAPIRLSPQGSARKQRSPNASEQAHAEVLAATVKNADATTWLLVGVRMSLWTLSTLSTTVFRIFDDGAQATIESTFADEDGKHQGILVSDRASVFGFWLMAMGQVCWAHLLRLFVGFSQRAGSAGSLGQELLDHAALVFEYWRGYDEGELSREELQQWMEPLARRFEALVRRVAVAGILVLSGSCANLLAHAAAWWLFPMGRDLTHPWAGRSARPPL
ncbi:MAG: transposase [Myxococcota bacterium]